MSQSDHPFSLPAIKVYLITILFYSIVYMVLMVIPFHATLLGGTKTDIGLIMGATMLTSMFARPIAGRTPPAVAMPFKMTVGILSMIATTDSDP